MPTNTRKRSCRPPYSTGAKRSKTTARPKPTAFSAFNCWRGAVWARVCCWSISTSTATARLARCPRLRRVAVVRRGCGCGCAVGGSAISALWAVCCSAAPLRALCYIERHVFFAQRVLFLVLLLGPRRMRGKSAQAPDTSHPTAAAAQARRFFVVEASVVDLFIYPSRGSKP